MAFHQIYTKRGYDFNEVSSALQKAIRRNDARIAGYFGIELFESGMAEYCWKRLLTISAEDCAGIITQEITSLREAFLIINAKRKPRDPFKGRIFIAKAIILLCLQDKSRDADHLTNLIYDRKSQLTDAFLMGYAESCRPAEQEPIPDYAMDCHTATGKARGKTKDDFIQDEHAALKPRQAGFFDEDVKLAKGTFK